MSSTKRSSSDDAGAGPRRRATGSGTDRPKAADREGTISRLPSGNYSLKVRLGKDRDGRPVRVQVTGPTEADVRRQRNELLVRYQAALLPDPRAGRQTVAAFLTAWLEGKRDTIRPSTWGRYRIAAHRHLIPLLGRLAVGQLAPADVRAAYARLLRPPYSLSASTVRQAHVVLHQALDQAVNDGALVRNVVDAVKPPALPEPHTRTLTPDEIARLLATAEGDWRTLWLVALHTGLRLGELLGLAWHDVDWQAPGGGAITVRRGQASDEDQRPILQAPKSRSGVRVVPISHDVVAELKAHLVRQRAEQARASRWDDEGQPDGGLVFRSRFGTMLLKSNVVRAFKRDAGAAGIAGAPAGVSPHLLRHTYASSLLVAGRPVPEVAYLLGHGSPVITMRTYAHFVPGAGEGVAAALERHYATGSAGRSTSRPETTGRSRK